MRGDPVTTRRTFIGALATELQEHVKTVTAPYKYPREIEFVADLPKTISGKIRRTELRQMERDRAKSPSDRIPSPPKGERAG